MEFRPKSFLNIQELLLEIQSNSYSFTLPSIKYRKFQLVYNIIFKFDLSSIDSNIKIHEILFLVHTRNPTEFTQSIDLELITLTLKFCISEITIYLLQLNRSLNPSEVFKLAAEYGRLCTMIYLKNSSNINLMQKFSNSDTILHHLARQGYVFSSICMINWLQSSLSSESKRKAIISPTNNEGFTPLHLAALTHSHEMCKYLLYLGADPYIRSRSGHTAYDLIKDRDAPASLLKLLKPKLTSAYRHKASPKFYLNLGFLVTRYTIFLIYLIPHIGIPLASISLSLSASTCFLLIYLAVIDPGYVGRSKEKLEKLVLNYGDDTCTKCCTVQYKSNVVKHCWYCQRCVEKYDHHCAWIRNCVGKGNSHLFMIYLIIFSSELTFHTIMIAVVIFLNFNEKSVWDPSPFTPGLQALLFLLSSLMAVILLFLTRVLLWQVSRIYKGKTSFEIKHLKHRDTSRPRSLYEDYRQKSAMTLRTNRASSSSSALEVFIE